MKKGSVSKKMVPLRKSCETLPETSNHPQAFRLFCHSIISGKDNDLATRCLQSSPNYCIQVFTPSGILMPIIDAMFMKDGSFLR